MTDTRANNGHRSFSMHRCRFSVQVISLVYIWETQWEKKSKS